MVGGTWPDHTSAWLWCLVLVGHALIQGGWIWWGTTKGIEIGWFLTLDALLVTLTLVQFPLPAVSQLATILVMALLAKLCLQPASQFARVIRMLLVLALASSAKALHDLVLQLGWVGGLGIAFVAVAMLSAGQLVVATSRLRATSLKSAKSSESLAVAQLDRAKPYLPLPNLIHASDQPHSLRLPLIICFTDLVKSTELSEMLPDIVFTELLADYISRVGQIVVEHGGMLDKFTGDGAMIIFGLKSSADLNAEAKACATMALSIRSALSNMQDEWEPRLGGFEIRQRMGIHMGLCHAGSIGCQSRLNYTVLGRTVHVTARLEQSAEPDEILVSRIFAGLLGAAFVLKPRPAITTAGLEKPLQVAALLE
jgi:class 3 adenylate cyclase